MRKPTARPGPGDKSDRPPRRAKKSARPASGAKREPGRVTGKAERTPLRKPKGGTKEAPTAKKAGRPGRRVPAAAGGAPLTKMRIAKAMARAGLCSRRDGERWIGEARVSVNGKVITSPALDVGPADRIVVDGKPLPEAGPARLWRYYKPKGLVTSHRDPQGRPVVFDNLPEGLPRVVSIGRLDFNTEGLLLLTTDGALARHLELPATGWLRRYRVRAHVGAAGRISQDQLDQLKDGTTIEGVRYGPIEATLDSRQGANVWLTIGIREGKNREVRRVLTPLGLDVNRLIRISFGPFQLLDMKPGSAEIVRRRVLIEQLGRALAAKLGLDAADEAPAPGAKPPARPPAANAQPKKPRRRLDKKDRPDRLQLVDRPARAGSKKPAGGKRRRHEPRRSKR